MTERRDSYPRFPKYLAYELTDDLILRVWGYGETEADALRDAAEYVHTMVPLKTKELDPDTSAVIDTLLQDRIRDYACSGVK
jgi:hypothetical protein